MLNGLGDNNIWVAPDIWMKLDEMIFRSVCICEAVLCTPDVHQI